MKKEHLPEDDFKVVELNKNQRVLIDLRVQPENKDLEEMNNSSKMGFKN